MNGCTCGFAVVLSGYVHAGSPVVAGAAFASGACSAFPSPVLPTLANAVAARTDAVSAVTVRASRRRPLCLDSIRFLPGRGCRRKDLAWMIGETRWSQTTKGVLR